MSEKISKQHFEVNFITNPKLRPETVKAGEIADILKAIESLVESQVLLINPQLRQEPVIIGLANIKASSIDLQFRTPFPDYVLSAFNEVGRAVEKEDYSKLPPISYKDLSTVVLFTRKQKCVAEFVHQNGKRNVVARITPETKVERPPVLKGETVVYAKVVRVGGKEPKVELETIDGLTLYCDASMEITTKLGTKLYQTVGLTGTAQWDYSLTNIESFKISGVTDYERVSLRQAFNELANLTRNYYTDIKDVEQYISELRGSN